MRVVAGRREEKCRREPERDSDITKAIVDL